MPSLNKDYEEKRNFIRMFVNVQVKVTDPATGESFQGESKNLSGDGILFVTSKQFEINQKLNVEVSSGQDSQAPLKAEFIVARADAIKDGEYEVAGSIHAVN